MRPSTITEVTATGDVTTVSTHLRSVVLTAGADAATVAVRAGGSGGTVVLTLAAAANTTATAELHDALCSGGVHATLTGTSPTASFVYT